MLYRTLTTLSIATLAALPHAGAQLPDYESDPISYWETEPDDAIARLRASIENGTLTLDDADEKTFITKLLAHLDISPASQVLVYSKTSKQNDLITPRTPRAIYFNEDTYIGWVPGGVLEVGTSDPDLGANFYLLDHRRRTEGEFGFSRPRDCMNCHAGSNTRDLPGYMIRSVYPDANGFPLLAAGSFITTHESPMEERWGGWYVTGTHGLQRHMGNIIAAETDEGVVIDREKGANITDLSPYFDTSKYLAPSSDILALMLIEHQTEMHNRLNRASYAVRQAMHRQHSLQKLFKEPVSDTPTGSALSVLKSQTEKVLKHLLFAGEQPLEDDGIEPGDAYREAFLADRQPGPDGRSLKDLQLRTRLFKYRCSYMIYSGSFDHLPAQLKSHLYARLHTILNGEDTTGDYDHHSDSERRKIRSILLATKPDFAQAAATASK